MAAIWRKGKSKEKGEKEALNTNRVALQNSNAGLQQDKDTLEREKRDLMEEKRSLMEKVLRLNAKLPSPLQEPLDAVPNGSANGAAH